MTDTEKEKITSEDTKKDELPRESGNVGTDINQIIIERDKLKLDAEDARRQLEEIVNERDRLKAENNEAKLKIETLNAELKQTQDEQRRLAEKDEEIKRIEEIINERDRFKADYKDAKQKIETLNVELKRTQDELDMVKIKVETSQPHRMTIGGRDIEEVIEEKNKMIKSLEDELNRLEREHEDALQRLNDSVQPNEDEESEDAGEIPYDVLDRLDDELAQAKQELLVKTEELKQSKENEATLRKRLDDALAWKEQALASQEDLTAARNALACKEKEVDEERQIRRAIEARYDEKLKLKVCEISVVHPLS
jgi:chromosome segregation ATPase